MAVSCRQLKMHRISNLIGGIVYGNEVLDALELEAAKLKFQEMRARELSQAERAEAHALANAITAAMLRAYFCASGVALDPREVTV